MRYKSLLSFLLLCGLWPTSVPAHNRFIVRDTAGAQELKEACETIGCKVVSSVDDTAEQVFLVTAGKSIDPAVTLAALRATRGVVNAEEDQSVAVVTGSNRTGAIPVGLYSTAYVPYFGAPVQSGYLNQPAAQIVRAFEAQKAFEVAGRAIVADIDTGADPNHTALQRVLLPGWDFTRNQPGGSEMPDLQQSLTPASPCTNCPAVEVNESTMAVLDQSTAAVLDGNPQYGAFGHGTMVMGIIHLVAPRARLLPLKAFHSDGTGFLSDILKAIYYAIEHRANVINLSFDLKIYSVELSKALDFANQQKVVCTASVGNDGEMEIVYPAALQNDVMGVASTSDLDERSTFSNFGDAIVWVAAPGEAVISTYPFGGYGAAWGTSFSAPFVAGAVALLMDQRHNTNESQAGAAIAHAVPVGPNMGNGRLDLVQALTANQASPESDFSLVSDHQDAEIHSGATGTLAFDVVPLLGFRGQYISAWPASQQTLPRILVRRRSREAFAHLRDSL